MKPDDYIFYRQHIADEDVRGTIPTKLTHKEAREMLAASVRSADATIKKLMAGHKIRTRYGIYWATPKPV